ncbi:putative phosphatidylinositol-3,4,5-trisphosphate 3-phosphatase [Aspergillus lucknowensis]|uniref:phosphatidylinositol-3,4,5-trisphosphate 3-phosphatase n=1 Tax=Aspergillus lucknowensis TaxID=176173 RepID=A0ABR4M7X1_9EURO
MASILRQIVAGPRLPHPEAGLDLCYVTDNVIATSGPSTNYPKIAYRTPLKDLVNFLDTKHGENWCIWEFRAEGTGYPDSEVYGRIHHFPFPDHHPPPFALIPKVMASMRNWLQRLDGPRAAEVNPGEDNEKKDGKGRRVAVVHCKAGKGRSGTIACSYLISQEGWKMEDALQRFTERRMRVGFGSGVSIPSQLRWVQYVDRWTNEMGKKYVERPVEVLEIHVWGLRDGVKVAVEGFIDDGQKIKQFHLFHRNERADMPRDKSGVNSSNYSSNDGGNSGNNSNTGGKIRTEPDTDSTTTTPTSGLPSPQETLSAKSDSSLGTSLSTPSTLPSTSTSPASPGDPTQNQTITPPTSTPSEPPRNHSTAVLRPQKPLILPTSDINIDFERRSKAAPYTGLAMVTSIAHVWFNPYFEGGEQHDYGVFEVEWEAMDGIKGTIRKGIKALDRLKVLWRYVEPETEEAGAVDEAKRPVSGGVIMEPKPGEEIPETRVMDWRLKESEMEREREEAEESGEEGVRHGENIPLRVVDGEGVTPAGWGKDNEKDERSS